jgi:hypothetical protein
MFPAMRRFASSLLLASLTACTESPPPTQTRAKPSAQQPAKVEAETPTKVEPETPAVPVPAVPVEPVVPVEPPPPKPPAIRWVEDLPATPSSAPPPTSVLGSLPKAEAVALVVGEEALELVAVGPCGWRLELVHQKVRHASFEPASSLVIFYSDFSAWAIDLREPLATPDAKPQPVELARIPKDVLDRAKASPGQLSLCFPNGQPPPGGWSCSPNEPLPTDVDFMPEYLRIDWGDQPSATWQVPLTLSNETGESGELGEEHESLEQLEVQMLAGEWLRARADRRQHFSAAESHGLFDATPLAGLPDLGKHCLDAEDCGKSLPLGVSGWEYVIVSSSQGDLFHPEYAVYDPTTQRWTSWKSIIAGTPNWALSSELEPLVEEMGEEEYVLFDAGGRVFVSPYPDQKLCRFRFAEGSQLATGVECIAAGGEVVGFLSGTVSLGDY